MAATLMIVTAHPFVKTVARALRHRCGVRQDNRLLVATSGGADSVALLRALAALAPRRRWCLTPAVGHVQHHVRGDQAEADAVFTEKLADRLGLAFLRRDLEPVKAGNLEAALRGRRYEALEDMANEFGARFVVTAHHGDDQLETLLMRMMRGSSVRGLRGICWRRGLSADSEVQLIRPMLGANREAVRQFLGDLNQPWCEDHTNADVSRVRARLRRDVLPILHDLQPHVSRKVVQLSQHMRDLHRLLGDTTEEIYDEHVCADESGYRLNRASAREMLDSVLFELIRKILLATGMEPDALGQRTIGPIVLAIQDRKGGTRSFKLDHGIKLKITRDAVRIIAASK